jgi:hypothetical protein
MVAGMTRMLISEARVETERPSAYLAELCRHVHEASQAHQRMQARVEWSQDHGVISFGGGRCRLHASPGVLTLRAEAPDTVGLQRIERRVGNRLKRLAGDDRLTVTWAPTQRLGERPGRHEDAGAADPLPYPDTGEDTDAGRDHGPTTGTQSWAVKLFLILAFLALILIVFLHLMGGGLRGLHG